MKKRQAKEKCNLTKTEKNFNRNIDRFRFKGATPHMPQWSVLVQIAQNNLKRSQIF